MALRLVVRLVLLSVLLASCKQGGTTKSGAATRVVSMSPSTTEALFAIGAGKQTVGRSRYCDYPPEALSLPKVGGYVDPSFEAILGLRPDLVTGARGPAGPAMTERLSARGIETYFPETESFEAIDAMIGGLGAKTGHADEAKAVIARIDARVKAIEEAVRKSPRVRVLLVFGVAPVSAAGPHSFADEMVRRAGGTNVLDSGGAYPTIGMEHVLTLDPDLVVNAAMAEEHAKDAIQKDAPGWGSVRAVKQGKVVALDDESLLRPGPRIADGLAVLARAIHPEVTIP